jgi:hypothetical protein
MISCIFTDKLRIPGKVTTVEELRSSASQDRTCFGMADRSSGHGCEEQ